MTTKTQIKKNLLKKMRKQIVEKDDQAIKALYRIYEFQTSDEQNQHNTHIRNGVGFTRADAKTLSSLIAFKNKTGFLTPKQIILLKYRIGKYARQLVNISIQRGLIKI